MITVGFTGTRTGMTQRQRSEVQRLLEERFLPGAEFRHGDCVGADAHAADIARKIGYRIIAHPPANPRLRAFFPSDEVLDERPYLMRNRAIVDSSDFVIACPAEHSEARRSGTWATIRYCTQRQVELFVCYPD